MRTQPLRGLVAAPHTPFDLERELDLDAVEHQAEALARSGVAAVFVGGSTGEFASLTTGERELLAARWVEVGHGHGLRVVVHVGGNQVEAGAALARAAEAAGADAIAALGPHYYRPRGVEELLACCAHLAGAAPETPFYYYDIPAMTGLDLPLLELVERGRDELPTLTGVKFTCTDLTLMQELLALPGLDVLHGNDETLLAGLALGVRGAVGSTYNLAPGPYLRMARAFRLGDLEQARREQRRSIELVRTLVPYGYVPAARTALAETGVDVGPPRLPWRPLDAEARARLRAELEALGFFEWRLAPELSGSGAVAW